MRGSGRDPNDSLSKNGVELVSMIPKIEKLRPHHILCGRFFTLAIPERGEEYEYVATAIRELMESDSDAAIEVIEGVDVLCRSCSERRENRCESPHGNEEQVRKWDAVILKGLDISYGEKRTVKEFSELMSRKVPLDFCKIRCPWKKVCSVFEFN